MKKIYILSLLFFSLFSNAQSGITYQAVILNPKGKELPGVDNSRAPLVNKNICLRFKIVKGSSLLEYQETLATTTDEFGMVNVVIGTGTKTSGSASNFATINWDGNPKNLVVELDTTANCSNFLEISNQPFTSVPFALYAANSGTPGATGPQGLKGDKGDTGLQGIQGLKGDTGSQGLQGIQGIKGDIGATGAQGLKGDTGVAGAQGLKGDKGDIGLQGIQGLKGDAGSQGLQGIQGLKGDIGATGAQGLKGDTGIAGAQGLQGIQGLKGDTGATGSQGLQGLQGIQGLKGDAGATGSIGAQGLKGDIGIQGKIGVNGLNALIKTTVEPVGANCINGGIKIDIGQDVNINGMLDDNELNISQTKYICNGNTGVQLSTIEDLQTQISNLQTQITDLYILNHPSITNGPQFWQSTNLDVSTYSDGTIIPQVNDAAAWASLTTGAWCYYNNDSVNGNTYSKLYNWYAVAGIYDVASKTDITKRKKLAPLGYHIPSDDEWSTLSSFLGGLDIAGGKMKEIGTTHWHSPNTLATNSSNFTGLPGGSRAPNGIFQNIGYYGFWWSSSEYDSTDSLFRILDYKSSSITVNNVTRTYGFSVRCVRD